MRDVLHTPYVLGGREIGAGLDCLGVVSIIARRRGLPPPDGWPSIRAAWERGELPTATGFPIGWRRQQPIRDLRDGDVLLYFGPGAPVVCDRAQTGTSGARRPRSEASSACRRRVGTACLTSSGDSRC
jgi:cell wall-associated NlpC family hydrolase